MSHIMTALAMRQTGLKPSAKVVLYWIADHHNETTGQCFPSISRLAELCEMSRRSVEQHLADLEAAGLIKRQQRSRPEGGKTSNAYILRLSDSDAQNLRIPPAKSAHGGYAKSAHDITLENTNLGNEQICLFDAFNEVADRVGWPQVQSKSSTRKSAALARMRDCGGFENWVEALHRAASSDFLSGKATGTTPASFDWLNAPRNFSKLMEGNYDNRTGNNNRANGTHGRADRPGAGMAQAFAAVAERLSRNPQESDGGGDGFI